MLVGYSAAKITDFCVTCKFISNYFIEKLYSGNSDTRKCYEPSRCRMASNGENTSILGPAHFITSLIISLCLGA